ncbi:Zinc finger CCHC domain-containing protein 3 [Holothuria leucospilota]|uniref:Zinc finger CCHC domain-containing protein 3 n=1 Tax=Holothuria leucospilota TaxID=206669 RepID=A0A9Q1H627_HOLLE|nr:Zinc finger CCHC domain-containing protein 3 [Holothuria leucospilota]
MTDNLRRDFSVLLSLTGKEDVFDVLDELGVLPAEHLSGVQRLPGNRYDVTFKTADIRRRFWPIFNSAKKLTASWYAGSTSLVTVLHVPLELDDNIVKFVLGRYGQVVSSRLLCYEKFPCVSNGIRQYKVNLKKDIPSSLFLGGRQCLVRYYGQPRTCLKCGLDGHEAKTCDNRRCFKCFNLGHTSKDCKATVVCTTCNKEGHNFRECTVSFANKARLSSEWTEGGAALRPTREDPEGQDANVAEEKGEVSAGMSVDLSEEKVATCESQLEL